MNIHALKWTLALKLFKKPFFWICIISMQRFFFTRLELWLHSYAKQSHKYDFDWFDYLIRRTHNDDSRQNVSKSNYANYQNFEFHFYWLVLCEKKLWDEKKTFNRIKIGNEKKLTKKKVFTKEIEKKYFEFYSVNHVEKQKINPKFFLFQYWNVKAGFLLPLLLKCCKHSIVQIFPIFNIQANDNKSAENS